MTSARLGSAVVRQWWRQRWLLIDFMGRELRGRYIGSMGGFVWVLIHPMLQLATYALVFQAIFRVEVAGLSGYPFVAFVALGLWPWLAFQEGLQRATVAIKNNAALVRKVAFQHELLVFAAAGSAFAVHLAGFAAALLTLSFFTPGFAWAGVPVMLAAFAFLFIFAIALALLLSAIQVFVPDIEQLLTPVLSLMFYATPILYPLSAVPEWLRDVMVFNPLVHFIEPVRVALLTGAMPAVEIQLFWLAVPLLLFPALWFFRRLSPYFEDLL